jgi:CheY-like chemotaxis protein
MHLGKVWVESEVGQGSTFHVLLPVRQNENSEAWPELSEIPELDFNGSITSQTIVLQQPAILVVDDEPGVVDLYERYLRSKPFQIFRANSGVEALRTIREDEGLIRLILLDINMPGLNGWDVLKEMKDNPDIKDIPVIVCSIENDPIKAAALGARHSLLKPIVEDDLLHAMHEVGIYE